MIRPERVLRVDLGTISDREASTLLREMARVVACEVANVRAITRVCPGLDEADLVAIANIAVLEARTTWVEGRGRSLRSWVQQLVRWRLGETLQASRQPEEFYMGPNGGDASPDFDTLLATNHELGNQAPPDGWRDAKFAEVFRRTMAALPEADRVLVQRAVTGVSRAETARQLARGYTDVCHATTAALHKLRRECRVIVGKRKA